MDDYVLYRSSLAPRRSTMAEAVAAARRWLLRHQGRDPDALPYNPSTLHGRGGKPGRRCPRPVCDPLIAALAGGKRLTYQQAAALAGVTPRQAYDCLIANKAIFDREGLLWFLREISCNKNGEDSD